jgi:large subunit ribosomal protein L18
MATLSREERRQRIKFRIRKKIKGTPERPRLCIFRSNKEVYAQIIDDVSGKTLVAASSMEKALKNFKGTKTEKSIAVGKLIAEKAQQKGISAVVFDRNGYLYHGRVKALSEAAREAGLKF